MKFPIRALALAGMVVTAGLLAACDSSSSSPSATTTKVEVTANEFQFDPSELTLPANQAAEIELTNGGAVEHDITIDAIEFNLLAPIGETVTGNIGPLDAGSYEIYCSIPGHKESGMIGTLAVEADE